MRFVVASQIRTVASLDADARRGCPGAWRWKGSQAMLRTHFVWPFKGLPRVEPVKGSQSMTVLSMLPVAIIVASGDQLTTKTQLEWPLSVWRGVPVSQSHIRAVLSPLPLAMREEDAGENWVASMASP